MTYIETPESKHTMCPWHIASKQPKNIVYGPHGEQIVNMREPLVPTEENLYNTKLIASAPMMLYTLREVLCYLGDAYGWPESTDEMRDIPMFEDVYDIITEATTLKEDQK